MEEEELQVALAISASLIDQEVTCHDVIESSRLAQHHVTTLVTSDKHFSIKTYDSESRGQEAQQRNH